MSDDLDALLAAMLGPEPTDDGPDCPDEAAIVTVGVNPAGEVTVLEQSSIPPKRRGPGRRKGETYQKIKRGKGEVLRKVGILLLESEIEWCLRQPGGGIAKTIRRLIKEARWKEEGVVDVK